MPDRELGRALLAIARSAIADALGLSAAHVEDTPALRQPAATFVTLTKAGALRGCIGSLEPVRALEADVRENAIAAAFRDPRFRPLAVAEFEEIAIEVSVLTASERLDVTDEADLWARLRPGQDGLILEYGRHRATFLPQVWDTLPRRRDFVAALKQKAGLPGDFWSPNLVVSRYEVTKYAEGTQVDGAQVDGARDADEPAP